VIMVRGEQSGLFRVYNGEFETMWAAATPWDLAEERPAVC
jgi:hypothetical protein